MAKEDKKLVWTRPSLKKISDLLNRADSQGCIEGSSDPDGCGAGGFATSGYCSGGGNILVPECSDGGNANICSNGTWIH